MKKLLSLLFILLLFTSCEKEVEKPKDNAPKVNEEKIAQPIKPEIVEPEVVEPETTDIEEIVLPEADENTVTITIDFPEDFPETPYTEPELVSPEEFEWGEYVPFVRYTTDSYTNSPSYIYSFAVLDKNIKNLQSGKELYNLFNEKYLIENKVSGIFSGKNIDDHETLSEAFTKSHIIYISQDAKGIGRFYITKSDTENTEDLLFFPWNAHFDFFENGEKVFSETTKKISLMGTEISSGKYLDSTQYEYPETKTRYIPPNKSRGFVYYRDSENVVYTDFRVPSFYSGENAPITVNWFIYSIKENKVTHKINLPSYKYDKDGIKYSIWGKIEQVLSENYLLINFYKGLSESDYEYNNFNFATYLYDTNKKVYILLENYATNAMLSPDLNYLIYTDNYDGEIINFSNSLDSQKNGIYIKNLKNGNTVFFEHDGLAYALNWINREKFFVKIG